MTPLFLEQENTTLDGLIEFFEEKLGSDVMNVQMRNYQDKKDKNKKTNQGGSYRRELAKKYKKPKTRGQKRK